MYNTEQHETKEKSMPPGMIEWEALDDRRRPSSEQHADIAVLA